MRVGGGTRLLLADGIAEIIANFSRHRPDFKCSFCGLNKRDRGGSERGGRDDEQDQHQGGTGGPH